MSCIVFVGNCNFRCPYCHNPHLVFDPGSQPPIDENDFFEFLDMRKGKLDGVVISGGEPSLQPDFADFAKKVKERGFLVKIDTNCSMADQVITWVKNGLIDYIGIDYKAPSSRYNEVTYSDDPELAQKVHRVICFAVENAVAIDVRTTVHRSILSPKDLQVMRDELDDLGVEKWILQQFNPVEIIDDDLLEEKSYTDDELISLARKLGGAIEVRGLKGVIGIVNED